GGLKSVAFSPDGKRFATGGYDGTVRIWDVLTAKEIHMLRGHAREAAALVFSPDGKTLASGGLDHVIRVWDVVTGRELQQHEGHAGPVHTIALSNDDQMLASACGDRTVRLWSLKSHEQLGTLRGHAGQVYSLEFSPGGRLVASAGDDRTIRIWDVAEGRELHKLLGHDAPVYTAAFVPPGKLLASSGADQTLRFWDWSAGKELKGERGFSMIQVSPKGEVLGMSYQGARLWDAATAKELRRFGSAYGHCALIPDGGTCVTEEDTGIVTLWNVQSGQAVRRFADPGYSPGWVGVPWMAPSPDGRLLALYAGSSIFGKWPREKSGGVSLATRAPSGRWSFPATAKLSSPATTTQLFWSGTSPTAATPHQTSLMRLLCIRCGSSLAETMPRKPTAPYTLWQLVRERVFRFSKRSCSPRQPWKQKRSCAQSPIWTAISSRCAARPRRILETWRSKLHQHCTRPLPTSRRWKCSAALKTCWKS